MFFVHFSGFLNDNISQKQTAHPTEKDCNWHYVVIGIDITDWNKKAEGNLSDIDFSPWTCRDCLDLIEVIDTGTVDTRKKQSLACHVTVGDEDFGTIDFDSIVFLIARCMITEMYWQCDIEILSQSLKNVNFERCRFRSRLLNIHEAIDKCPELVESIEI